MTARDSKTVQDAFMSMATKFGRGTILELLNPDAVIDILYGTNTPQSEEVARSEASRTMTSTQIAQQAQRAQPTMPNHVMGARGYQQPAQRPTASQLLSRAADMQG